MNKPNWRSVTNKRNGENKWLSLIQWFNQRFNAGLHEVLREDMLKAIDGPKYNIQRESVCDHYRKTLELAGYLIKNPQKKGYYILLKEIPEDITMSDMTKRVDHLRNSPRNR